MTTESLMPKSAEVTELSLDDLEQASGGHHSSHNDGLFYGALAGGIALVGGIIIIGLLA